MMSYRLLLKKTAKIIDSKRFKAYLFSLYKANKHLPSSHPIARDWLSILETVVHQQNTNRQLRQNGKKYHNEHCVMGYYGFVFGQQELTKVQCRQEIVKLFMRVQMYYLMEQFSLKKSCRLPIYSTIPGYHQIVFQRQLQGKQRLLKLQYYNVTVRFR